MLNTLWGVVKKEKIELLEKANIPEGTKEMHVYAHGARHPHAPYLRRKLLCVALSD